MSSPAHDGGVTILERLVADNPTHERNAPKRVFAEVMRAWPGEPQQFWWKWFGEASSSLGLHSKTLDCSLTEACSLAAGHTQVICYCENGKGDGEWLAVLGASGRRFHVLRTGEAESLRPVSKKGLKSALSSFCHDGQVRCVVLKPNESAVSSPTGKGDEPLRPWERLWQLLRPEAADIWLVVVFAFAVSLLMLATPIAVEALVNTVAFGRFLQPILVLAFILLMFLGFQGAVRALQTYVVEIIQRRLFARVAGDLAFRLPRAELEAVDGEYLPELVNRFFDVVTVQKVAAQLLLDGLGLVLNTLIGMAVLGFYHPWLLGFDLFLLAAIAIIVFVLGRGAVSSSVKESKTKYYMAGWLEDVARCTTAFRVDGGADFALERADRHIQDYLGARRNHFRIVMRQVLFALGLQAVASTVLLGLGGWLVVSGELTLGQLVAAELIVTVIVGSFAKFGKHMESFYDLLASVDKLGVLFDLPTERQDGMLAIDRITPSDVQLYSVNYHWPQQPLVIENLTAKIESGARVAVVGGPASGKSTLLDILFGLRTPTEGHLTVDGFDPRDLRPDILRNQISLARGHNVFHATIEENVHLHREDVTSTDIRDVLDALGLLDPILRFEDALGTTLTATGAPLSENQCRLLAVARAAVGRPNLLLVDGCLDALSGPALDRCLAYLCAASQPWTLIVATSRQDIAQRLDDSIELLPPAETISRRN